ncbi:hypothetical protein ABT369_22995 [Dactylosporangium sp. NPDC000244]|uniref:hypothetical protein n=1 Tax=Dactylosporangium sp. NPDC000244 TaxID=3154365 RepID=UPI00332D590B
MTDYGMLLHAYGRAEDTPGHLAALTGGDEAARGAAMQHLWGAIIHQGTPWIATPPAAATVAELLPDVPDPALRANLLNFLAAVAEAAQPTLDLTEFAAWEDVEAAVNAAIEEDDDEAIYGDELLGNAVYARAIAGCREAVPAILAAAQAALSDPDPGVRAAAGHAIGACAAVLPPAPGLEELLVTHAAAAGPDERAALVLAMGELGLAPRAFLSDPHPGVRACAALALPGDEAATEEILTALLDPAGTDAWFTSKPPQFPMRVRFPLIVAAVERVADPAHLLPAALALAPVASIHTARSDWGLLLKVLPEPQRAEYLRALAANGDLWDPRNGSAGLVFRELGLPYDRAAYA